MGNFKEAGKIFKSLADNPEVSDMLKKRASEMAQLYSSRFGDDEKKPIEKTSDKKSTEESDGGKADIEKLGGEQKSATKK